MKLSIMYLITLLSICVTYGQGQKNACIASSSRNDGNKQVILSWTLGIPGSIVFLDSNDKSLKNDKINLMTVYPNPNFGKVTIILPDQLSHNEDINITLFDYSGKLVPFRFIFSDGFRFDLDLRNNPSGMYILKVNIENKMFVKNIFIQ